MFKKIIFAFILTLPLVASSAEKTAQTLTAQLSTYQESNIKKAFDEKKKTRDVNSDSLQDQAFDALAKGVELLKKDPSDTALQKEVLRVTVLLLQADPSQYAGEVILPLYQQDKKKFLKSLSVLPKKDADLVRDAVMDADREQTEGNG
jgi:hypothetical protein